VGVIFSAPVQTDPGAHPASFIMGTGSIPGVKRQGRGVNHPPPSSAEFKERVRPYLYSLSEPPWQVIGELYLQKVLNSQTGSEGMVIMFI